MGGDRISLQLIRHFLVATTATRKCPEVFAPAVNVRHDAADFLRISVGLGSKRIQNVQRGIRFFSFRTPAALWIRLAAFLPYAGNVTGIILLPSE
jgi:hypothetical protein